jgi:hypothetical protein
MTLAILPILPGWIPAAILARARDYDDAKAPMMQLAGPPRAINFPRGNLVSLDDARPSAISAKKATRYFN